MHQKEKEFLEELSELELILKEYTTEFFVRGKKHSEADRQRFYRFLENYNIVGLQYHQYKKQLAEHKSKESKEFYEDHFKIKDEEPKYNPREKLISV